MKFSHQIKTSKTDEYYTPDYAVDIIVPFLREGEYNHIWCPFDKLNSEFVKVLNDNGFTVTYGHIDTGQDFFKQGIPEGVDCIVSNPPFSKRQAIFERLFKLGKPFALVMNFNGLFDSKSRWQLFKNNQFELLIPKGRIKFFDETMTIRNSPNFQSVYVCSGILDEQIIFTDMVDK